MTVKEDFSATAVGECRMHLLRAAANHPQIRLGESLNENVFKPSRKRWAELGLPVPQKPGGEWTPEQFRAVEAFQLEQSQLIENWAASHNLNYEWVHSAVRNALSFESFPRYPFDFVPGYQPPEFLWRPWYFAHETEEAYRKLIKASFRKALEAYIGTVKQERGQFLKDRGSQAAHYRWVAERVCLGRTWSHIARENGAAVTWQAVQKAVLPILERIRIPVQHNFPRPKKVSPRLSQS